MTAAAHRDFQIPLDGEAHRGRHVGWACAAGDDRRPAVDDRVPDPPRLVVAVVIRQQNCPPNLGGAALRLAAGACDRPFDHPVPSLAARVSFPKVVIYDMALADFLVVSDHLWQWSFRIISCLGSRPGWWFRRGSAAAVAGQTGKR